MAMDYLWIKGYKSIAKAQIELSPINVLIGGNGAGKSNLISFFEFLSHLYRQSLQHYVAVRGGQEKFLHQGSLNADEIEFKISFDNRQNGYHARLERGDSSLIFTHEYLIYQGNKKNNISNYGPESSIKSIESFRAKYVSRYLESYRKYHFHDTGKDSPFSKPSHIDNDGYFLYEEGENLAAYLFGVKEKHPIIYKRIIRVIQSIAPFFADFYLHPNESGYLRFQWLSKFSSYIYGVNDLSDGTLRFIALVTLFLQPDMPSSIIIDEPELGLHPVAIAKLAGLVKSAAKKDTQIIMATQSADLINHFKAKDVVTVDQIEGKSVFHRVDEEQLRKWLEDYSLGDLWQRNILSSGQPNF